ncbi:MAG: endonuclease domain-containing protein, partial [Candidatus Omnitrophica bacterium]|nr:endonuclease domain-containing protein [Candidatus Omnitrophota bacterium]
MIKHSGCSKSAGYYSPFVKGCQVCPDGVVNSPFVKGWQAKPDGVFSVFKKLPYNPALKERARKLRKTGNLSEALLWNKLKKGQLFGFDFTRQQIIGNYIVDFHCLQLNLVIEIDGESHDFKCEHDWQRDNYLKSLGLT